MSQPNLLKPSDLTKLLLMSPSKYCENEVKRPCCSSEADDEQSCVFQAKSHLVSTRSTTGEGYRSVQVLLSGNNTSTATAIARNPNDTDREHEVGEPSIGISSINEWAVSVKTDRNAFLDEQIPHAMMQFNSEDRYYEVMPEVLKQLILPDSKLKQNEKILKEFKERNLQTEQQYGIEENNGTLVNPPLLKNEATHYEEVSNQSETILEEFRDHHLQTKQEFCIEENIVNPSLLQNEAHHYDKVNTQDDMDSKEEENSHTDQLSITEMIPTGNNELVSSLNDVNKEERMDLSQPKRQESDTTNDAAIAAALQEELKQSGGNTSKQNVGDGVISGATPHSKQIVNRGASIADYKLACKMQEKYDEEMASMIQYHERGPYEAVQRATRGQRQHYPSQGYLLQSRTCTNEIPGFHQRSDRELDRERRLRYLEQRSHQGFLENPPILRSNSIELTYEELYELKDVPHGLDASAIQTHTSTFYFTTEISRPSNQSDHKNCLICLTPYEVDELLRLLPCMHSFHRECIDTWLSERRTCPVCLRDLISDDD